MISISKSQNMEYKGKGGKRHKRKAIVKRKFTDHEDEMLTQLVNEFGLKEWKKIAHKMKNRTPRQCRERWKYYLSGNTHNEVWTEKEDELLLQKYKIYGPHWAKISAFFTDKNDVNLKNRFHRLQRNNNKPLSSNLATVNINSENNNQTSPTSNSVSTSQSNASSVSVESSSTLISNSSNNATQSSASEDDPNRGKCGRRILELPVPLSLIEI
ncbi:Myb-like DNA-binding domain containing protein [Tritrichomonas foetus]|uniref:Myb-like DNA-binding domain containing protein n=1 Tax=Tritrichomonas foetus TaxID=1144522 RepID=A0A1J4K864_9EUKA|nr:Myb-like DNA-binding domain containing protein [Tritrichomonas foetus]|eukprot:OHT07689.1 Myb-like DNA-binding domain containing protein [Tritrichomonas foetus]